VLKQLAEFGRDHEITTFGYGPTPPGVAEHIRIPDGVRADDLNGRLITLRLYRRAYWSLSAVSWGRDRLKGRSWDVAIANDVEAVPLALSVMPRERVHADLHEFSPRLHEDWPAWNRRIAPYVRWLCRTYVARAASWTTVGRGLADEYGRDFGFRPEVVTNATPYVDATPTAVQTPIAIVHSGACLRGRNILETVTAVQQSAADVRLDLYLTPNDPGYLDELRAAASLTPDRVRVLDPVPYEQLISTLQGYDLGIHVLAPTNFNNRWALPNKLFDYVQARLGVVIGPSPEMADYIARFGIGVVAEAFDAASVTRALDSLTPEAVAGYRSASHAAAHELSAESQVVIWRRAVERLEKGAAR